MMTLTRSPSCRKRQAFLVLKSEIVFFGCQLEADFLDFRDLLVLLGFSFFLGLLEHVLAVVHDLADRIVGLGEDQDQIQILVFRSFSGFGDRYDPDHAAVTFNQTHSLET